VGKPSQVVILAEDQRQVRFIRAYLKEHNFDNHDIRVEPVSSGRGSGEQWVRERYADAVRAYRWRSTRAATALVVMIDADTGSADQRLQQLRQALVQADLVQRLAAEKIAHLVPKRNIETWVLCLSGTQVDEDTDYRNQQGIDKQIQAASTAFFDWSRANAQVPQHCVPSLLSAIPEARRLEE
jgi:hypothetical protein